jgi:bacterial/archaeal transporter family-2 protein
MQAGYLGWAFAAGVLIPVMAASNGALTRLTGNPAPVMLSVFAVGLLATAAVTAVSGVKGATALMGAPPYLFCGGLIVAFYVLSVSVLTPRIGVVSTITMAVAGQILMSAVIDHFGLFGAAQKPVDLTRAAGLGLLLAGLFLTQVRRV